MTRYRISDGLSCIDDDDESALAVGSVNGEVMVGSIGSDVVAVVAFDDDDGMKRGSWIVCFFERGGARSSSVPPL